MNKDNLLLSVGQISMAVGVLLNIFFREHGPLAFISGVLVGMSLVFNITFLLRTRKAKV